MKNVNIIVSHMITRINESKTWTKRISWEYKYKFNRTKRNSNQKWN